MNNSIPSPFWQDGAPKEHAEFLTEFELLCKKHGFGENYFVAFGEDIQGESVSWSGYSKYISDGLAGYLEEALGFMQEMLSKENEA